MTIAAADARFRRSMKLASASVEVNSNPHDGYRIAYEAWCETMGYDYSKPISEARWKVLMDILNPKGWKE